MPPAHLWVSLRHESPNPASSTCSLRAQAARDEETRQSGLTWILPPIRRSSEESNDTGESRTVPAEVWFDRSNKNVGAGLGPPFVDNDPPFFLHNQSLPYPNLGTDTEDLSQSPQTFDRNISQFDSDFVPGGTNGSSIHDFRSVIDDLTIENKRLRERLRRYERSYGAHLERDKLFEVKVHGLNPDKKRELEETLHAFASSISKDGSTSTSTSQLPMKDDKRPETSLRYISKQPSPTSTNSRLVDSAYASLSTSGPFSLAALNRIGADKKGGPLPASLKMVKVQNFLDDIPQGLFPKHPTVMTERGKKKLVVRRLEQVFTGKLKASRSINSQPQQQQEMSNSAARDDRQAIEHRGQHVLAEGVREAHILSAEMEVERAKLPKLQGDSSTDSSTESQAEGATSSPDQRPTRPLDLDPDRAQVPVENIEYIRHLGISTPVITVEDSTNSALDDSQGWVYLNLLVNMAQLHIINVTPDFIRSAVTELSTKFQLSPDGRKIRWRGGKEGTELSSDSGADNALGPSHKDSDSLNQGNQKRRKIDSSTPQDSFVEQNLKHGRFSSIPISTMNRSQPTHVPERRHDLYYKPLFAHHSSSGDDEMSLDDSTSQISYVPVDESGTGLTSNGAQALGRRSHSGSSSKRKRDDGAIVFYSKAPFCTDLSGDRDHISTPLHVSAVDLDGFSNHSHDALGCKPRKILRPLPTRTPSGSVLPFRPFKDYSACAGPLLENEARTGTPELVKMDDSNDLIFSPPWTSPEEQQHLHLLRLEACGLGGTRPADHFAVTVETRRRKLDRKTRLKLSKFSTSNPRSRRFLHMISESSLDLFRSSERDESISSSFDITDNSAATVQAEILSTCFQYFEPSDLPPPATYHGAFSTSTESSDGSSLGGYHEGTVGVRPRPHFRIRTLDSASPYNPMDLDESIGNKATSDDIMDESDTSSIDVLARAREINPEAVAAKEQKYERETSWRLARESPTGISVAMADSVDGTSSPTTSLGGSEEL